MRNPFRVHLLGSQPRVAHFVRNPGLRYKPLWGKVLANPPNLELLKLEKS